MKPRSSNESPSVANLLGKWLTHSGQLGLVNYTCKVVACPLYIWRMLATAVCLGGASLL